MNEETEHIEDKQSLAEWKEIVESTAAFATSGGGCIRVGITPDGHRKGVEIGKKTLEDLANRIAGNTHPPQYPSITFDGPEESAVIRVVVEESPVKPVWAFNAPMKRVGRTNQRISPQEVERLMQLTTGRTWDALPCEDLTLDDIDSDAARAFLRRCEQDPDTPIPTMLENLKLIRSGTLLNGAPLLFAKDPQRFVVQAIVKCGRFEGTSQISFLDERTIYGNVFSQIEETIAFVGKHTRQAIAISGKPERDIVPEYPDKAVREAVINAICHRDYVSTATVQVRINDECLEIWNPGILPPDFDVEELYRPHRSRPRNPNIAGALHRARFIEHWGTGTLRMVDSCRSQGLPDPAFSYERGLFVVRFQNAVMNVLLEKGKVAERWGHLREYLRKEDAISLATYRTLFELGRSQAQRDLADLVEAGLLVLVGKGRAVRYRLP